MPAGLRMAEDTVNVSAKRLLLAEYQALLGWLSSGVAHEINNSLGQIYLLAGMPGHADALERVRGIGERIASYAEVLVTLSRPAVEQRPDADLAVELKAARELVERTGRLRNCRIVDNCVKSAPTSKDGFVLRALATIAMIYAAAQQDLSGAMRVGLVEDGDDWVLSLAGSTPPEKKFSNVPDLKDTLALACRCAHAEIESTQVSSARGLRIRVPR